MAKVRIKNLNQVLRKIEKIIGDDLRKNTLQEIGEMVERRIVAETRKGNSLVTESKMKPLQDKSKFIRRALSKKSVEDGGFKPGKFFRWNKSNLSQTGQLLDSIKHEVDVGKGRVTVSPTGNRDPSLNGRDEFATNAELARDLQKRGFLFLGLDGRGVKRIRQMIIDEIRRLRIKAGFR